jgi:hypothetical protein
MEKHLHDPQSMGMGERFQTFGRLRKGLEARKFGGPARRPLSVDHD